MKKSFSIFLSVILVLAFAGAGVFADSFALSSFFTPGYNSNITVVFDDVNNTISLSGDGTYNASVQSQNCYQISGTIEFNFNNSNAPGTNFCNISNVTYSNLVGCTSSGSYLTKSSGSTFGSFDFSVTNANGYAKINLNQGGASNQYSVTYTVKSLTVNNVEVISSVVGEVFNFTLSPGYALVINGPCEISDRSYSISGSWNFDRLINSRINGSFERVVQTNNIIDGFSPDRYLTIEQLLPWWADNSNALGVASNYSYHNTDVVTLSDGGINYVLGYPLYYQGSGDYSVSHENAVTLTGSIYFQYSGTRPTISKIAIESLAEIVEGHYHYYNVFRPDVYDETGEVVSDGQGGTVVDFPDAPPGGGNSGQPPVNEETNLFGVLSKFVNDIKNLISQGSHAISELVNYGSSFMHSIAQIFDWLPATLTTLIFSAFSIVLVIGVIKLLWK